ncbi:hypothetical protein ikelab_19280 [Lactococcus garvieae]|uniref:Uncharacterized protein n=1 Tax=Lactococcus garvieae TaxID=1363 RepID=A0A6L2ZX49_9LACT|nr:hypothetical protein [Lactococcus garvieae]GFO52653.1 hypothetical protein ikelab_19280 [Lactococcus garvieae]
MMSKAQLEANRKYRKKFPEKTKHDRYRNQAKIFINKHANEKDLKELENWLSNKYIEIEQQKSNPLEENIVV